MLGRFLGETPGGQTMLTDAVFADEGRCNIQIRDTGLRRFVEIEDALAVDRHPIRTTTDRPANLHPRHAAEIGRIARHEVGIDEFQTETLGDHLSDIGFPEIRVSQAIDTR